MFDDEIDWESYKGEEFDLPEEGKEYLYDDKGEEEYWSNFNDS